MAATDAVDGATVQHRECYSGYLEAIAIQGGETAAGEVKELARTVRRNADKVVLAIGRTRLGHRTLKCVLTIGTRSAQSNMASGHCAAQTGRTHDRTRPMLQPRQKVLAKAPSTHDPWWTSAFRRSGPEDATAMPVRESPEFSLMGVERVQTVTAYTERLPHQIGHVDFAQRSGEILLGNRECRLNDCADELRLRQRLVRRFDPSHGIQPCFASAFCPTAEDQACCGNRACAANARLKSSIATLICAALFALSSVRNRAFRLRSLSRMTHRRMKTCASYNDVIRTAVATSGRCASKWRSKGKVILERCL